MSDENAFTNVPSGLMIKVQVAHEEEREGGISDAKNLSLRIFIHLKPIAYWSVDIWNF